jgi:hypothetical protein
MILRAPVLFALLLAALPAAAQDRCPTRRNVDCAGAARAVDAAIAGDPWLALIDQAQRMRLAEVAPLIGEPSAAELAAQQATWRRSLSRQLFFHPGGALDEPDPRGALRGAMEYRLVRLMRLQHNPPGSIDGDWVGVQGQVVVERAGGGHFRVSLSTADVHDLAWLCDYDGEGDTQREEWMQTRDGVLELRREGVMLRVRQLRAGATEFCGAGGSMSGLYFRVGEGR